MNAWIVGGGLAGITSALELSKHGFATHIFEARERWGGLLRSATWEGDRQDRVAYEPHGSHIVHTDDAEVWSLFNEHAPFNDYRHSVLTMVRGELFTWPIQESEVRRVYGDDAADRLLTTSNTTMRLAEAGIDFESWCLNIMPQEVYDDFVAPYTEKQWGRHPSKLSASFAPKRVQVRRDGDRRLFKDQFQGFPDATLGASYETMLASMLAESRATVHTKHKMTLTRVQSLLQSHPAPWRPDVVAVTAPLDDFCGNLLGRLEWRGLTFSHKYLEPDNPRGVAQEAMVVNWPGKDFPFIRTHETKHASGQRCKGTVLTTEFTGGPGRYYPVPRADGRGRLRNDSYVELVTRELESLGPRVLVTGRLATYRYQDTDEVARDAIDGVRALVGSALVA